MLQVEVEGLERLVDLVKSLNDFGLIEEKQERMVHDLAYAFQTEWRRVLTSGCNEIGLKKPQWGFSKGIRVMRLAPYHYTVESHTKYNKWMVEQEKDLDLKTTHPYGKKSRVSKKGVAYLIVPFAHLRPNKGATGMPQSIRKDLAKAVKKNGKSFIRKSNAYATPNARGENVFRSAYQWGGRTGKYEGELSKYSGMSDFDRPYIDAHGKRRSDSRAFTFRVISAKSPSGSWIRKARPTVLPYVIEKMKGQLEGFVDSVIWGE